MFRHQGVHSDRQNRILAGYLAFVGGFVNSAGFVLIGTFTSHVTGNVGRAAHDFAAGEPAAGAGAAAMVLAFFGGAFLASVIVESPAFGRLPRAYATALALEGALLGAFAASSKLLGDSSPRLRDAEALLLCVSMGMQNSLVTRLSGAVVRTTHLTGVTTDLGIEAARWFRYGRAAAAARLRLRLVVGRNAVERPQVPKA
ncbi:MAG TPA: YoaK family protein, partial [Polyangiaceae bacterium]|nr:YoaK family protein [Polyangiaceae bacterium]